MVLMIHVNLLTQQMHDYLVCTSAFRQGVLGSNPIAARKSREVYPGLGILQTVDCCPSISLKKCLGQLQNIINIKWVISAPIFC